MILGIQYIKLLQRHLFIVYFKFKTKHQHQTLHGICILTDVDYILHIRLFYSILLSPNIYILIDSAM